MIRSRTRWLATVLVLVATAAISYRLVPRTTAPVRPPAPMPSPPPGAMRVLFVGNSHTLAHDVPGMVRTLAEDGATPIRLVTSAVGGYDLASHLDRGEVTRMLRQHSFDVLVVQPQGVEAIWQPEAFTTALHAFEDEARAAGARMIVWAMWARDPARDQYDIYREPWGGRDLADQTRLQAASTRRAARTAVVAPIGEAWLAAHEQLADVDLHFDGSHATLAGAYLTALVLDGILHDHPPDETTWRPEGLSADTARELRRIATDTLASSWRGPPDAAEP